MQTLHIINQEQVVQKKTNEILDNREQNTTIIIKQKAKQMEECFSEYKILMVTANRP